MSCTYEGSIDPRTDDMHVVSPGAAGLDVHKMQITAAVRICEAGGGPARVAVREFSALPNGLRAMTDWLLEHSVTVAALESTGVYWKAPLEALEDAGIQPARHHAEHVRQIRGKKTGQRQSLARSRLPIRPGLAEPRTASALPTASAAWAGVVPGNRSSAGRHRATRVRAGNRTLRATLTECAHGAARSTNSQFHCHHRLLAARLGYKRAVLGTAHKLLRVIHAVLRNDRPYEDPDIDYARLVIGRGAPRWIHASKRHGLIEEVRALHA